MLKFDPLEIKLLLGAVGVSIVSPMDMVFRFLVPIISGASWIFLKPVVVRWRDKVIAKRKLKK